MRHRFIRSLFGEVLTAGRLAQIVLLIPFIVLLLDAEIFYYAWNHNEEIVLIASGFVLLLSILEIIVVFGEIHQKLSIIKRRDILEERLTKIANNITKPTVKKLMNEYVKQFPNEEKFGEVYRVACDLMCELRHN